MPSRTAVFRARCRTPTAGQPRGYLPIGVQHPGTSPYQTRGAGPDLPDRYPVLRTLDRQRWAPERRRAVVAIHRLRFSRTTAAPTPAEKTPFARLSTQVSFVRAPAASPANTVIRFEPGS